MFIMLNFLQLVSRDINIRIIMCSNDQFKGISLLRFSAINLIIRKEIIIILMIIEEPVIVGPIDMIKNITKEDPMKELIIIMIGTLIINLEFLKTIKTLEVLECINSIPLLGILLLMKGIGTQVEAGQ